MPAMKSLKTLVAGALLVTGFCAYGAEPGSTSGKPMKMDEPMPTKMAKPGMKQGDVKKAAEKKEREMASDNYLDRSATIILTG